MVLVWRAGVQHVLPDALSRLPHTQTPQADVDDSFRYDFTSKAPFGFLGPREPSLDGIRLAGVEAVGVGEKDGGGSLAYPPSEPFTYATSDACLLALQALPFATCAVLETDPGPLRRGSRMRKPSVRLRPLNDIQLPLMEQLGNPERDHSNMATPIESTPSSPPPMTPPPRLVHAGRDGVGEVLSAGGGVPRSSEARHITDASAIDRAVQVHTNPASLARRQRDDSQLGQVRKSLCGSNGVGAEGIDTTGYGLDDDDVIRYTDDRGRKLPAIPEAMVADVLALVHTLHGQTGVEATLALMRDHFHWPSATRDTRQ